MEKFVDFFLRNKAFSWLVLTLILCGGMLAYLRMGKLEDAPFTIKQALVTTSYPGASPIEVQQQVTDILEESIQSLDELYYLKTENRAGLSKITVYVKKEIRADQMQQLWDKLRRKVNDVQSRLPAGAGPSVVNDDFGDVLGVFYGIYSDTHSNRELEEISKSLKNELLQVRNVARVERFGIQNPTIDVTVNPALMTQSGITTDDIAHAFERQNKVVDAGAVETGQNRLRIDATGSFTSLQEIENMTITSRSGEHFRLCEIARISESYAKPARNSMYVNNSPGIGLAISTVPDGNVVDMSRDVKTCIARFADKMPAGYHISNLYDQGQESDTANRGFIINLLLSVITVVGILFFFIGFRNGLLVGSGLVFSILVTLIYMWTTGIALQRMSLAAIIIAMGMLVDNAIVVFDSALVNMQRGISQRQSIRKAVSTTAIPLLAATAIAILTFVPIYLSPHITGELLSSLVIVIGVSLFASWVFAITQNAFFIQEFVQAPQAEANASSLFHGPFYDRFRASLRWCIRHRWLVTCCTVALLTLSLYGYRYIPKVFVPELNKQYFTIDMWAPEGTRIEHMEQTARQVTDFLVGQESVRQVSTFVGQTPPRYYLANAAFGPQPNYAQCLVEARSSDEASRLKQEINSLLPEKFPDISIRLNNFNINSVPEALIEARFRGNDPQVLDSLVQIATSIMRSNPKTAHVHSEWGNQAMTVQAAFDPVKAGQLGISKNDMSESVKAQSDGIQLGIYRDKEKKVPVVLRSATSVEADLNAISNISVWNGRQSAPLAQVAGEIQAGWEWPLVKTYNRQLSMSAMCDVQDGYTMSEVHREIRDSIESIQLPEGYSFFWDAQYKDQKEAMQALSKYFPLAFILLVVILVGLFGNFRQPLIILLMLPLSLIGVIGGLLVTGFDFGFFPIAGWLGLLGMIIKNVIVLADEVNNQVRQGEPLHTAVIEATVSRMRPVLMAALTTICGMIPLLFDIVFGGMAATVVFGLAFATLLTLFITPTLFAIFYKITCN